MCHGLARLLIWISISQSLGSSQKQKKLALKAVGAGRVDAEAQSHWCRHLGMGKTVETHLLLLMFRTADECPKQISTGEIWVPPGVPSAAGWALTVCPDEAPRRPGRFSPSLNHSRAHLMEIVSHTLLQKYLARLGKENDPWSCRFGYASRTKLHDCGVATQVDTTTKKAWRCRVRKAADSRIQVICREGGRDWNKGR